MLQIVHCVEGLPFFRGYIDAGDYGEAILLGSDCQLDLLRRNGQFLHFDGTFWVVPALFRQLFSLFVKINGKVLYPALFVIIANKVIFVFVFHCPFDCYRPSIMKKESNKN
jgi:hypothetical protein